MLESKSDADYIPNLPVAGRGRATTSSSRSASSCRRTTQQAAETYPDTNFAIIDATFDPATPTTRSGCSSRSRRPATSSGTSQVSTPRRSTVSSVGGQKIPPVDHYIAGFQQGAKDANPDVKVLNGYSQDFVDQAKCKEVALDQIANGSDVVFQVAGGCGLGALDAADQKGVWGIGVDADQAVPRRPHPHERAEARGRGGVRDDQDALVDNSFAGGDVVTFGTGRRRRRRGHDQRRTSRQEHVDADERADREDRRRGGRGPRHRGSA